jgi:hypothetical protein
LKSLEEYAQQSGISAKTKGLLEALKERLAKLSSFPTKEYAHNLLCLPNLCLTDGGWTFDAQHRPISLSAFAVIDRAGTVLFHQPLNRNLVQISQAWEELQAVLIGLPLDRLNGQPRVPRFFLPKQTALERSLTMLHAIQALAQGVPFSWLLFAPCLSLFGGKQKIRCPSFGLLSCYASKEKPCES